MLLKRRGTKKYIYNIYKIVFIDVILDLITMHNNSYDNKIFVINKLMMCLFYFSSLFFA